MDEAARRWAAVEAAIEGVYVAFQTYPRPAVVGEGTLYGPEFFAPLLARPRRELRAEDVQAYAMKAMTTCGTAEEYGYFLPRLVELAVQERDDWALHMVGEKMRYAETGPCVNRLWTTDERAAVDGVGAAWWRWALAAWPGGGVLGLLELVARTPDAMRDRLAEWDAELRGGPGYWPAMLQLAQEIAGRCGPVHSVSPPPPWEADDTFTRWFTHADRVAQLETAYFAAMGTQWEQVLSDAHYYAALKHRRG